MVLVNLIHLALTPLFDVICWPLRTLAPVWALALISCGSGVLLVWLFGRISDQQRIREVRDRIRGNLLGVRLFRRDVGVVLRLQLRIFADTFRFLRLAAVPMLIMLLPVILIMTQLNLRFAVRPVEAGHSVVVTAVVRESAFLERPLALEVSEGVVVETPPVKVRDTREIAWRVRVATPGVHSLRVQVGGETLVKQIVGGPGWGAVPQRRAGRGLLDALLYPGEPPVPAGHAIEAVEVGYRPLDLSLAGMRIDWLVAFLLLSMACGFACRRLLRVEI